MSLMKVRIGTATHDWVMIYIYILRAYMHIPLIGFTRDRVNDLRAYSTVYNRI